MIVTPRRVGAGALALVLFATPFAAIGSGAFAQDQAEPQALETVETAIPDAPVASPPQVRFVASEVVQDVPEDADIAADPLIEAETLRELVASTDTSAALAPEVQCLAQAVYFEARGESLAGQLAVARVIINRAESDTFPDDYCSVVTQRSQFSFVRGGRIPTPDHGSASWTRARAIARIAHRDLWDSEVGDALYFHARHVRPRWAGRMTTRATIENHIFSR